MITDKRSTNTGNWRRALPWLNLLLAVALVLAGLWYLSGRVSLAAVGAALAGASPGWVTLAAGVVVVTLLLKGWRWQLLFPNERPPVTLRAAFWATTLGQYVNLVVPFLRLGEVARLYGLNRESGVGPARAVGTLVVEKTLDLVFFGLTIAFVLPFVVLPATVNAPGPALIIVPIALLAVLYLLAYRTAWVIGVWRWLARPLPERLSGWLLRVAVSGLEGLAALRDRRRALLLLLTTLLAAVLSVLMPYLLFPALGLSLSLLDAALIHIVVTVAITPPSTPAKLGVFNGAVALMLLQLGVADETAVASYAILFYLVAVAPPIVLGVVAASRSHWRWSAAPAP